MGEDDEEGPLSLSSPDLCAVALESSAAALDVFLWLNSALIFRCIAEVLFFRVYTVFLTPTLHSEFFGGVAAVTTVTVTGGVGCILSLSNSHSPLALIVVVDTWSLLLDSHPLSHYCGLPLASCAAAAVIAPDAPICPDQKWEKNKHKARTSDRE